MRTLGGEWNLFQISAKTDLVRSNFHNIEILTMNSVLKRLKYFRIISVLKVRLNVSEKILFTYSGSEFRNSG